MKAEEAIPLIRAMSYKPGWKIFAHNSFAFEDGVEVVLEYTVQNSDKNFAPNYEISGRVDATFTVLVGDCVNATDLAVKVFGLIMRAEQHEAREFFAVNAAYDKPFHPHTTEGIRNWSALGYSILTPDSSEMADVTFGRA